MHVILRSFAVCTLFALISCKSTPSESNPNIPQNAPSANSGNSNTLGPPFSHTPPAPLPSPAAKLIDRYLPDTSLGGITGKVIATGTNSSISNRCFLADTNGGFITSKSTEFEGPINLARFTKTGDQILSWGDNGFPYSTKYSRQELRGPCITLFKSHSTIIYVSMEAVYRISALGEVDMMRVSGDLYSTSYRKFVTKAFLDSRGDLWLAGTLNTFNDQWNLTASSTFIQKYVDIEGSLQLAFEDTFEADGAKAMQMDIAGMIEGADGDLLLLLSNRYEWAGPGASDLYFYKLTPQGTRTLLHTHASPSFAYTWGIDSLQSMLRINNKIIVLCWNRVIRLNEDFSFDTQFGDSGILTLPRGIVSAAQLRDGRLALITTGYPTTNIEVVSSDFASLDESVGYTLEPHGYYYGAPYYAAGLGQPLLLLDSNQNLLMSSVSIYCSRIGQNSECIGDAKKEIRRWLPTPQEVRK